MAPTAHSRRHPGGISVSLRLSEGRAAFGLLAEIRARFGEDATFHTCSAEGLDADGIVAFLEARGKFVGCEGEYQTSPEKICNH